MQRYSEALDVYQHFTKPLISSWNDDSDLIEKINTQVNFSMAKVEFITQNSAKVMP